MGLYPGPPAQHESSGLELAGTVSAVGERVELWSRGDRVMGVVGGGACRGTRSGPRTPELMAVPAPVGLPGAGALPEVFYHRL